MSIKRTTAATRIMAGCVAAAVSGCSGEQSGSGRCPTPVNNSCVKHEMYCDEQGQCQPCPSGTINCDGDNYNLCEVTGSSCEVASCGSCGPPSCCDNGVCRAPGEICSGGGICGDGSCGTPCDGCESPGCCDGGVCRAPGESCSSGGLCSDGVCGGSTVACADCSPPSCCDDGVCRAPGETCAGGGSCGGGECYDPCALCIFPYCCDAGYCRVAGQTCSSGGPCLDASCGPASCEAIAPWSAGAASAGYDAAENRTFVVTPASTDPTMLLRLDFHHDQAAPPRTLVIPEGQRASTCAAAGICARLGTGCSAGFSSCQKVHLALGGTLAISRADQLDSGGGIEGRAADLWLVEWDETKDRAATGWGCYEIGEASVSATW